MMTFIEHVLWQHEIVLGLALGFVPSILASLLIIRTVNFERFRESSAGRYVKRYMSNSIRLICLAGNLVMMIVTWCHLLYLIVIVLAWSGGLVFKKEQSTSTQR